MALPLIAAGVAARIAAKKLATKAAKKAATVKNARATKDAKIVATNPQLKLTPNMTLKQAKAMKQGTKQLAKATKQISRRSNRNKNTKTTVGDFNRFLEKNKLDKPTTFPSSGKMKALDTPAIGGKINAPSNMTLRQVDRGSYLEQKQNSKAYAAAYRQAKREISNMKKATQSKTTRNVKKVAKVTGAVGAVGATGAAIKNKNKKNGK